MLLLIRRLALFLLLTVPCLLQAQTRSIGFNTKILEDIIGVKGTANTEERVFKFSFPRTDVPVAVDGWTMTTSTTRSPRRSSTKLMLSSTTCRRVARPSSTETPHHSS